MRNITLAKILLTAGVAVGGVGFLVYSGVDHSERYKMVDELMASPGQWVGKPLRVHGWVEPGSIVEKIEGQQTRRTFILAKAGKQISVVLDGPAPDTFRDQAEVVATGHLIDRGGGYQLEASEISAKCPSKYEGAESIRPKGQKPVFQ
jgi:cytochrome c-type biogenesis protein CcmE